MMQLHEARTILEDKTHIDQWMLLDEATRDALMEVVERRERRMNCCAPYDCMCHEQCDGEGAECGSCAYGRTLAAKIDDVNGYQYDFARALHEVDEDDIRRYRMDHARELESIGDYAAAERLLGAE